MHKLERYRNEMGEGKVILRVSEGLNAEKAHKIAWHAQDRNKTTSQR